MSRAKYDKLTQYFKEHDKVRSLDAHQAKVHSVAWNSDGHRLASGSFDRTVCVFILDNGRLVTLPYIETYCYKYVYSLDFLSIIKGARSVLPWTH